MRWKRGGCLRYHPGKLLTSVGGRPNLISAIGVVTKWRSEDLHASERALHIVFSKDELQQWFLEDATVVARCSTRVALVMRLLGGIATPRQDVGLHVCKPRRRVTPRGAVSYKFQKRVLRCVEVFNILQSFLQPTSFHIKLSHHIAMLLCPLFTVFLRSIAIIGSSHSPFFNSSHSCVAAHFLQQVVLTCLRSIFFTSCGQTTLMSTLFLPFKHQCVPLWPLDAQITSGRFCFPALYLNLSESNKFSHTVR